MRNPQLPLEELDRSRRIDFNSDVRRLTRAVGILGAGHPNEVAARTRGVRRIWMEDEVGKMVALVMRNGTLEVE